MRAPNLLPSAHKRLTDLSSSQKHAVSTLGSVEVIFTAAAWCW